MVSEFAQRREEFDDDEDERRSEAAQETVKGKKGLEEATNFLQKMAETI